MTSKIQINRIDFEICFKNFDVLSKLKKDGRPLILTKEGRGVAAIIPYTDPSFLKDKHKCHANN